METQRHRLQMDLLMETLRPWLTQRQDGYVGGNRFFYYSLAQVRNRELMGPDVLIELLSGCRSGVVAMDDGGGDMAADEG
jgi:hypothetical protein